MVRTPKGYDLWFGTCGWKSLVHSEIGIGIAAGKVGNPCMWCQYDDDVHIKFTRCCEKSYRRSIHWSLIDRSRVCRLSTAVRSHGLAWTSVSPQESQSGDAWRWCARTWCITALPEMTSLDATSCNSCELMEDNTNMQSMNIYENKTKLWKKSFISEAVALGLPSFAAGASNADLGMKETFPTTCFLSHIVPVDPPPELRKVCRDYSINNQLDAIITIYQ